MSYLKEFLTQINNRDFHKFLVLWEEYCASDVVDAEEFIQLLKTVKASEMAKPFGQIIETTIPLWKLVEDEQKSREVISLLVDLECTNNPALVEIAFDVLKKSYGNDPKFEQKLRLIGIRNKDQFQGSIAKYDLLNHMTKGNFVFHTGGWGTGEIIDVSFVREHLTIDFENVAGHKDISFTNAYKTLIPLQRTHFLARRYSDPDLLEKEGKEDAVGLVKLLLRDMGPHNAADIKNELCELVIPEKDWTKWWQNARAKIKKDLMIETPDSLKESFYLRKVEFSPEERLKAAIQQQTNTNDIIQTTYNFVRDTPGALKNSNTKEILQNKLIEHLNDPATTPEQTLQIHLLLEQFFSHDFKDNKFAQQIQNSSHLEEIVQNIEIVAFKKRILTAIKEHRRDWVELFLSFLFKLPQAQLRDYLVKELNQEPTRAVLSARITALLEDPTISPETFLWYFQKLINDEEDLPYQSKEGKSQFFESFLILLRQTESQPVYKDLVKKIYTMLSGKRYALVRQFLQDTTIEYTKEILLLASKCHTLTDHDKKILRSLSEVVHPSLAQPKKQRGISQDDEVIWTSEEGYLKIQDKIRHIGTIEMIDNAREIEAARALGDLRENSEFKFAQERRARLQSELGTLSQEFGRARVINKDDVLIGEVGVGSTIEVVDDHGKQVNYSILGPWDADPEKNILSFNSRFAQAMIGKKVGESFQFKNENFRITNLGTLY